MVGFPPPYQRMHKVTNEYVNYKLTDIFPTDHEPTFLYSSPVPTPTYSTRTATTLNLQVPPPLIQHHRRSGSADSSVSSSILSSDIESHFPTSHKKSSLVSFFESIGHHKHNSERALKGNPNGDPAERPKREPREKRSKTKAIVVTVASSGSDLGIPTLPPPAFKIPRKTLFRRRPQHSQARDTTASDTGSE